MISLSARPILDKPTSSLAPKMAEGKTLFPGHISAGIAGISFAFDLFMGFVVAVGDLDEAVLRGTGGGTGVSLGNPLLLLKEVSSNAISALDDLGTDPFDLCFGDIGRLDFLREVGLMIFVGDLGPFLRKLGRFGEVGLLSERSWSDILSAVYFLVLIAPV